MVSMKTKRSRLSREEDAGPNAGLLISRGNQRLRAKHYNLTRETDAEDCNPDHWKANLSKKRNNILVLIAGRGLDSTIQDNLVPRALPLSFSKAESLETTKLRVRKNYTRGLEYEPKPNVEGNT